MNIKTRIEKLEKKAKSGNMSANGIDNIKQRIAELTTQINRAKTQIRIWNTKRMKLQIDNNQSLTKEYTKQIIELEAKIQALLDFTGLKREDVK